MACNRENSNTLLYEYRSHVVHSDAVKQQQPLYIRYENVLYIFMKQKKKKLFHCETHKYKKLL